jgi:arylsulfatase A-like enzyme
MKPPNILYILSDEHRGQAMGHAGDPNVRTPNMDRMAKDGASFRRAYANCPVCTPSRGTIFSGRHAHCGPVQDFFGAFPPAAPSTATWLRQHGYHTSYIGKWHCGVVHDQKPRVVAEQPERFPGVSLRTPENRRGGFQDWAGFEVINSPFQTYFYRNADEEPTGFTGYQTDILTDEAIRQLKSYDREEPVFMVLSVEPPHFPCIPPETARSLDPQSLLVDPSFAKLNPMFEGMFPHLDESSLRTILANYYLMVENLDENIGRLLAVLEELPAFQNTLVVYFSDHGDYVGNHGINTDKINHHEESLRIPSIFRWPGRIPSQGSIDGLFGLVDLQATVLGLAGIPPAPWDQGFDWSKILQEAAGDEPEQVLIEMSGAPRWTPKFQDWRGLVNKQWKYAFYDDGREFLHDLESDPFEMENLAHSQPETTRSLRERLLRVLEATREPFFDILIRHGVPPETPHYLRDEATQRKNAHILGGLDNHQGPLPMA